MAFVLESILAVALQAVHECCDVRIVGQTGVVRQAREIIANCNPFRFSKSPSVQLSINPKSFEVLPVFNGGYLSFVRGRCFLVQYCLKGNNLTKETFLENVS